jgi:hypothetical protein
VNLGPIGYCARAQARFYELAYAALGVRVRRTDGLWWVDVHGPVVFPVAGTLRPDVDDDEVLERLPEHGRFVVTDAWDTLDLRSAGLRASAGDPWMLRPPGRVPDVAPVPGLRAGRARTASEVETVEATIVSSAGGLPGGFTPGSIHPAAGTLAQPDMHLFLGLLDSEPVATAMAGVDKGCLFISGVSTMPEVRGRGIASVLTAMAVGVRTDLPAALATTSLGRGVYERQGFTVVGRPTVWEPPPGVNRD